MSLLLALLALCTHASALVVPLRPSLGRSRPLRMAEGVDEIAELEQRLAELKRTEAAQAAAAASAAAAEAAVEAPGGFDLATMSMRKKVAAVKTPAPEELLSESWKAGEVDDGSEGSGSLGLVQIAGGAALALAVLAFSQVPVGQQNLDPATYGGYERAVETPSQIAARYNGVEAD